MIRKINKKVTREDEKKGEKRERVTRDGIKQGVTKRSRLSLLTNSALVIRVQIRGRGGVAGTEPVSTALHIT